MKSLKYILFISFSLILFSSCEKDDVIDDVIVLPEPEETLDVNDENISGEWTLVMLNGDNIDGEGAYFYITLNPENNGFIIIDKMNSSFPSTHTGIYKLDENIISGIYDYSFSMPWSEEYKIKSLLEKSMTWIGVESDDVLIFEKIDKE